MKKGNKLMRAYHPAGLALAAFLLASPAAAQALDPELTRAAHCAGIIKGAASVGFALGAKESAVEATSILPTPIFSAPP